VFFDLFSEAEPFAAILIAHRNHVFWGGLLRLEGPKFEAEGPERGRGSWGRAPSPLPFPPATGPREHCKLPQRGSGRVPLCKYILDLLRV